MKYLISACLAGQPCRYDGAHCGHSLFSEMVARGEALPVCPEQLGGLPTPRECSEIRMEEGIKRVFTASGIDVSSSFLSGAQMTAALAEREGIGCAILKNYSPSCGFGKIYDGTFSGTIIGGSGICADLLRDKGFFLFNGLSFLTSEGVTLKQVCEDDFPELVRISRKAFIKDSLDYSPFKPGGPEGFDSIQWHREAVLRGKFLSIQFQNKLIGGLFYTIKRDHTGWINRIFIKPGLQSRGIGRRVFFQLEQNYPRIREWGLDTPVWSKHNQSFYQSMGYRFSREIFSREAGFTLMVLKKKIIQEAGFHPV